MASKKPQHRQTVDHRDVAPPGGKSNRRDDRKRAVQGEHRRWISALCDFTGLDPTALGKRAGIAGTTITRLLNDKSYTGTLSSDTVRALTLTYDVPGPSEFMARGVGKPAGVLTEAERVDLAAQDAPTIACLQAIIGEHAGDVELWRLQTDALVEIGYMPGDLVAVAPKAEAKNGDAVRAQIFDLGRLRVATVWRVFRPPYLIGAARDPMRYQPFLLDSGRGVTGVIVGSLRLGPNSARQLPAATD